MEPVLHYFSNLFNPEGFPPRWYCGQWDPFTGWFYIVSDIGIWSAYFAIPLLLLYVVKQRKDLPFPRIFWLFAAFIFACGSTHLLDAIMFWFPIYRFSGVVYFVTAVISWVTVAVLIPILPEALSLKSPSQLQAVVEERTAALEEINERYRLVVQGVNDGIWDWNIQTGEMYWNDRLYEMLGVAREAFTPAVESIFHLIHPQDQETVRQIRQAHLQSPDARYLVEFRAKTFTGEDRCFIARGEAHRNESGQPIRMAGTLMDVTEKKRIENALKESEERFRTMAESIPQLAWMAHPDGWIFWYNERWYRYTGTEAEDMQGWGWQSVHDRDELPSVMARWQASIDSREPFEMVFPLRRADGVFRPFLTRAEPVKDEYGNVLRWFGTHTDITEQLKTQQELAQAKKLAEDANQNKTQFLANMSHELRTPLNAVIGYSGMLEKQIGGPLTDKQIQYAHNIKISGQHLLQMVSDILDIAKIEAGCILLAYETVDLASLLGDLERMLSQLAQEKKVALQFHQDPALVSICVDPLRFRQILTNLISNAIKFNRPEGKVSVTLRLHPDGNHYVGEVTDTGIGIPQNNLSELFSAFYQVDSSNTRGYEGTGLGLSLTRHLVTLHGGSLTVQSEEGQGSVFSFKMPLVPCVLSPPSFENA